MKHFGLYSTEILYQSGISGRCYVSRYECCLYEGYPVLIKITNLKKEKHFPGPHLTTKCFNLKKEFL